MIPFVAGAHAGLLGTFILLSLGDGTDLAYTESITASQLIERPEDVAEFTLAMDMLRIEALSPEDSLDFIRTVQGSTNVKRNRAGWRTSVSSAADRGDCVTTTAWRKSSYSNGNGGACVEVGVIWRKSSYSGANGGDCVEVAGSVPRGVAVRDSKDPEGLALTFTPAAWESFTAGVRNGEFTLR